MNKVKLIAMSFFPYGNRHLGPGDAFEAVERDAAMLRKRGKATLAAEAEAEPDEKGDPKRYKHRMLRSED